MDNKLGKSNLTNLTFSVKYLTSLVNDRLVIAFSLRKRILELSYKSTSSGFMYNETQFIHSAFNLPATPVSIKLLLNKLTMVEKLIEIYKKELNILQLQNETFDSSFKLEEDFFVTPPITFEQHQKPTIEYGEFMMFLKKKKNNFFINLHLYNGKLLYTGSVGKMHFLGPKRSTLYGLEDLAKTVSTFLAKKKVNYIRIFITSKVNKRINRAIKLLKYNYPKLRYIVTKVIKYQHSKGLKLKKLRRV